MNIAPNATSSAAAAPPPASMAAAAADLSAHLPVIDVPFTSISGIRRIHEDGGATWEICIGVAHAIGIAHGADFKGTLAEALKDLARRKLSVVR